MKLHHLRDLLAVVEHGSMRGAAKHLGLSQPALSRSIRDLERELGVPLLERHARGAAVTALGEQFSHRAGAAFQELRRALEEVQQLQGGVAGTVVACLSSLSHVAWLPAALAPFRRRYPQVELRIIEGVYPIIERRLLEGVIDFYLGPAPASGSVAAGLRTEKLSDNQRVVLARKGHPLRHATTLAELTNADWVTTSITNDPQAEFADVFLRAGLPAPRLALRAETMLTWLMGLTSTDMLAISPMGYLASPLVRSSLVRVPVREVLPAPPIILLQRASIPLTPAAEHLANLLRNAAGDTQARLTSLPATDAAPPGRPAPHACRS